MINGISGNLGDGAAEMRRYFKPCIGGIDDRDKTKNREQGCTSKQTLQTPTSSRLPNSQCCLMIWLGPSRVVVPHSMVHDQFDSLHSLLRLTCFSIYFIYITPLYYDFPPLLSPNESIDS